MDCAVCGKKSNLKCGSCGEVRYCSIQHQKQDWPAHRDTCKAFNIIEADGKKQWVAARNLEAGIILMDEAPLLQYPRQPTACTCSRILCITCGRDTKNSDLKCSKCGWPVCGEGCEQNPVHAADECPTFVMNNFHPGRECCGSDWGVLVAIIRGIGLKLRDPSAYRKLTSLPQDFHGDHVKRWVKHGMELAKNVLPGSWALIHEQQLLPEFEKIMLVAEQHQLSKSDVEVEVMEENENDGQFQFRLQFYSNCYVYDFVSYLTHSCVPNCSWSIGPKPNRMIRIRTALPIKQGEVLTIAKAYNPDVHACGTRERQTQFIPLGITCTCIRCKDPTELGTYLSALECIRCKPRSQVPTPPGDPSVGYLLLSDPLDKDSRWGCNNHNCTFSVSSDLAQLAGESLKNSATAERYRLNSSHQQGSNSPPLTDAEFLILLQDRTKTVHLNHWALKYIVHRTLLENPSKLLVPDVKPGEEDLQGEIQLLRYLLAIEDKISPGINQNRATIQMALGNKLFLQVVHYTQSLLQSQGMEQALAEVKKWWDEATAYFDKDFTTSGMDGNFWHNALKDCLRLLAECITHLRACGCEASSLHQIMTSH